MIVPVAETKVFVGEIISQRQTWSGTGEFETPPIRSKIASVISETKYHPVLTRIAPHPQHTQRYRQRGEEYGPCHFEAAAKHCVVWQALTVDYSVYGSTRYSISGPFERFIGVTVSRTSLPSRISRALK